MKQYLLQSVHAIGEFQSRFILTSFYWVVVPLFALLAALMGDPLALRAFKAGQASCWTRRRKADTSHEAARLQG